MGEQLELRVENEVERADREGCLRLYESRLVDGERYVSVVSIPRGGQIRGFRICSRGCAHLALPDAVGEWPELDAWVARKLGVTIDPRPLLTGEVAHPDDPTKLEAVE